VEINRDVPQAGHDQYWHLRSALSLRGNRTSLFSSQISSPNSTMQKEDSLSYRNTGTYIEY
jgi:hypothetical protein